MHKVRGQRANVQLPPSPQRPIPNCPEWLTYRNQLPHRECEAGCIYKQEIGTTKRIISADVCRITLAYFTNGSKLSPSGFGQLPHWWRSVIQHTPPLVISSNVPISICQPSQPSSTAISRLARARHTLIKSINSKD